MSTDAKDQRRILIGITGASGSIYAERLINHLLTLVGRIYVVVTPNGEQVLRHELRPHNDGFSLLNMLDEKISDDHRKIIRKFNADDLFAPVASGSSAPTDMVIVPCSMGSLGRIAHGMSSNLLERAADVVLKQRRRLVICPRETPLHALHLRNLLALAELGTHIVPPMPAFYQNPKTIDDMINFVVGRILEVLDFDHVLYKRWNARMM